tara:strand:- start:325 stop:486 length:162 start_codon:yes stop_codon:yes gene_type:complete
MAASDNEQKSIAVPQRKRLAMGEDLTGDSFQAKGGNKKVGGLGSVTKTSKKNK